MAVDYTTTELIANCKRRGYLPAGSGLTSSAILQVLTEQLRTHVPAFLKGIREEYLIATLAVSVSNGVVNAPSRAVGAAFRNIKWILADGSYLPLSRIEPENSNNPAGDGSNIPYGYTLQANKVRLVPSSVTGTVLLSYQQRPGQLVLPTDCVQVTGAGAGSVSFATGTAPPGFVALAAFDIVKGTPNFEVLAMDMIAESVDPDAITFSGTFPTGAGVAAGDWLCLAGETCIPPVILEVHDLIAQAAASKIANSTGSARATEIKDALKDLTKELTTLLTPRDDGAARPIISGSRLGRFFVGW